RLNYILNNEPGKTLCDKSLVLSSADAWQYIRARQKQTTVRGGPVTMRTISRERNLLQDVFRVAIEEWGYVALNNPFRGLKLKGSKFKRTRRLEDGELELLEAACWACHGLNRHYILVGVWITLETGMREQEVFNLQWRDIDFDKRTIKIRKSKTDHTQQSPGRTIVLPFNTLLQLSELRLNDAKDAKPTERIFPMTQEALSQSFDRAVERAGLDDFEFRDLRREANSRWSEIEPVLSDTQKKLMLGQLGSSVDINDTYSAPNL